MVAPTRLREGLEPTDLHETWRSPCLSYGLPRWNFMVVREFAVCN